MSVDEDLENTEKSWPFSTIQSLTDRDDANVEPLGLLAKPTQNAIGQLPQCTTGQMCNVKVPKCRRLCAVSASACAGDEAASSARPWTSGLSYLSG